MAENSSIEWTDHTFNSWIGWIGWDGKTACPSATGLLDPVMAIARMGKKSAGRLLDGIEHNEFPRR